MAKSLDQFISEIESLIRTAQGTVAQNKLGRLQRTSIPRERLHEISLLASRAGNPDLALNLMRKFVRPTKGLATKATPEDLTAYAVALFRLGADSEAKNLLSAIDAEKLPRTYFYRGLISLREWSYAEAARNFREYLGRETDKYQRFTCKLNLAQTLIILEDPVEAEQLLQEALFYAQVHTLQTHRGNALAYLGGLEFYRGDFAKAESYLAQAEQILKPMGGMDYFFVRKWMAINALFSKTNTKAAIRQLENICTEAVQIEHRETLRDIDYHLAVFNKDGNLYQKLYFGTPYNSFRARLKKVFNGIPLNESFLWVLGAPNGVTPISIIDLDSARKTVKGNHLKTGHSLHRLYSALTSDIYRRFHSVTLFEKVFPGEFYSPTTSALRVQQAVKLLRIWFTENKLPLSVEVTNGFYYLASVKLCGIPLRIVAESVGDPLRISLLREKFQGDFSTSDAKNVLRLSHSGASKIIKKAVDDGTVEAFGSGRTTKYRFARTPLKKTG